MEYSNINEMLITRFPELKDEYEADREYYHDIPHVAYGDLFVPYIKKACRELDMSKIERISLFLEEMELSEDDCVNNLVGVSVIESLLLDEEAPLTVLRQHLKKETLKDVETMENWKP